jgi:glycosyltransferase involved in cell wall biosynthesis
MGVKVEDMNAPKLSVIVPISEGRIDDLRELYAQIVANVRRHTERFEVLFVIDGQLPAAVKQLEALHAEHPDIQVHQLHRWFGEATALTAGFERARGEVILTLPSYFQIELSALPEALARFEKGDTDLLMVRRQERSDFFLNRIQAWVFHGLLAWLTGQAYRDVSSGVRIMARAVAQEVRLYGDLHRFFPLFAYQRGFRVAEFDAPQHPLDRAARVLSPGAYMRRLLDMLTIFFLFKFTKKPLRFFGLIGSALAGVGVVITAYLVVWRFMGHAIAGRPLLLFGALLMVLGIQLFSLGLLGELIIFTQARNLRDYQVLKVLED